VSPYVRTVKTASGARAVQIVHSSRRGSRDIEHIGSAHDDAGRNILTAFQSLGATYTPTGLRLDRLTTTQRANLNHLNINPPWPEQAHE
jgi:hypothetical protein